MSLGWAWGGLSTPQQPVLGRDPTGSGVRRTKPACRTQRRLPQPPPLSRGSTARFYPPTFWLEPDAAQGSERHSSAKRGHTAVLWPDSSQGRAHSARTRTPKPSPARLWDRQGRPRDARQRQPSATVPRRGLPVTAEDPAARRVPQHGAEHRPELLTLKPLSAESQHQVQTPQQGGTLPSRDSCAPPTTLQAKGPGQAAAQPRAPRKCQAQAERVHLLGGPQPGSRGPQNLLNCGGAP